MSFTGVQRPVGLPKTTKQNRGKNLKSQPWNLGMLSPLPGKILESKWIVAGMPYMPSGTDC